MEQYWKGKYHAERRCRNMLYNLALVSWCITLMMVVGFLIK